MAGVPAAEFDVDERVVRRLLHSQAPDLADRRIRRVGEGWDCSVWRLGDDLAVRLPRRAAAAAGVAHEQQFLPDVAQRITLVGVPAPVVCGWADEGFPWPWSVVPWFHGRSGMSVPRPDRSGWAVDLARSLRELHVPAGPTFPPNPLRGVPLMARDEMVRDRIARLDGIGGTLMTAWAAGVRVPAWDGPPVWIHGDLHPGNLVVRAGALVAMIDFIDLTAGDPAYDLAVAWLAFDAVTRNAFRDEAVGYDDATWVRARSWAAAMAALLLDAGHDHPDHIALGRETVTQLRQ